MAGDRDDWAIARDAANYFGADAGEIPPPPNVVLEGDGKKLVIPAETWGRIWCAVFADRHKNFDGKTGGYGLVLLAEGAKKIGFADWSAKLDQFRAGMKGTVAVKREDGSLWTPPVLQDYMAEKTKTYKAADRDATRAEVLEYFAKVEDNARD